MRIRIDYTNMIKSEAFAAGICPQLFELQGEEIRRAHAAILTNKGKGWYGWCDLPFNKDDDYLNEIITYGEEVRRNTESFVVFGIGGSALGTLAVASSLLHLRHNELSRDIRRAPKLYVEDNIDPERMASLLDVIDISSSHFNFVTKSGETSETLSQFHIIYNLLLEKMPFSEVQKRITITTTVGRGTFYEIAQEKGLRVFDIEAGVGGRFSVLSNVGLVPFAVMGFDIKELLRGARMMTLSCLEEDITKNPALLTAFLHAQEAKRNKKISVIMPYADSLKYMADFYAQLFGESLGKKEDCSGNLVRTGQTPVKALGVTDQHSQVQLFTEGPLDKIVTFIEVASFRREVFIPKTDEIKQAEFLTNNNLSKLINTELEATVYALAKAGCSNYTIILPCISENTIGQLLTYFMYKTAFCGAFLNIDAFNQPGVEEVKKAIFAILGREGYEKKLQDIINQKPIRYEI